jgi:hypothetical protein
MVTCSRVGMTAPSWRPQRRRYSGDAHSMDILSNVITGLFTLLGTLIGSWLTSGRARHQKLWDVRREAYSVITSELGAITRVLDIADAIIAECDLQSYFATAARDRHEAAIHKHCEAARQRFADDYLMLSDTFIARFEKLVVEMDADDPNEGWDETHERKARQLRAAKTELTALARQELTQQRPLFARR